MASIGSILDQYDTSFGNLGHGYLNHYNGCLAVVIGTMTYKLHEQLGKTFLLSWIPLSSGVVGWYARIYNIVPDWMIFEYGVSMGSMSQLLFLSIGVGDRFKLVKLQTHYIWMKEST